MRKMFAILAAALLLGACQDENLSGGGKSFTAPSGIQLHSATDSRLIIEWDEVVGADGYEWKLLKGEKEVRSGRETIFKRAEITGLAKGTKYVFQVRATAGSKTSDWSSPFEVSTAGEPVDTGNYEEFGIPDYEEDDIARAFPGAEGGGMFTTGGRGGKVLHVTTLADDAKNPPEGSLRWAVNQSGARTVVFDVAGIITLKDDLKISHGSITIAGQTAPGDGICLKDYTVNISAGNVIIRFMRFRLGDQAPWSDADIAADKADGEDCIWGRYQERVIIDHCSMSWSIDEGASFYGNEYFTLQWCIIAESMKNCRLHSKGNHGYGGIWGGKNASFHHNLLAHHDSRNPRLDHPHIYENHTSPARRGNVDYRNNVIYNWGGNNTYGGEGGSFNVVGNYYKLGPDSSGKDYILDLNSVYASCSKCGKSKIDEGYPSVYVDGNRYEEISSRNNKIYWHDGEGHANYGTTLSQALPISGLSNGSLVPAKVTSHSYEKARDVVCANAGASLRRDAVDVRIASDVLSPTSSHKGTGGAIIKDINDVRSKYGYAWPEYSATEEQRTACKDSDGDGIPDTFEDMWGLDKNKASDGADTDLDIHGRYTNLEMYLHYLVKDIVKAGNAYGQYITLN